MGSGTVLHRIADAAAGALSVESRLPGFDGATGWLNSPPLTEADLRGKVVLVDFWTYTCINWLRTLAHVRAWSQKYEQYGLIVVGVHTPEFPFERDVDNVRWAVEEMAVEYPVALDSDYAVWDAFANRYWPAVYIADADGRIRHHHFGEGGYEECERVVQRLLRDAGGADIPDDLVVVEPEGFEVEADWANLRSPETYLGYERGERFTSGAGPGSLRLNEWDVSGDWTVDSGACVLNGAGGQIAYRFHARDVHLVMSPRDMATPVPFRVLIDGSPPGDEHGLDVDEQGRGTVAEQRLYGLVRQQGPIAERTIEIEFPEPGVEAYVFTFG
jgi:thiol-disulfide isomerase/thioredoxin